jgi:hypothetical protein
VMHCFEGRRLIFYMCREWKRWWKGIFGHFEEGCKWFAAAIKYCPKKAIESVLLTGANTSADAGPRE